MVAIEDATSSTDSFVMVFRVWSANKVSEIKGIADYLRFSFFQNEKIEGDHRYAELIEWSGDSNSIVMGLRAHGLEIRAGEPREAKYFEKIITIKIPQK